MSRVRRSPRRKSRRRSPKRKSRRRSPRRKSRRRSPKRKSRRRSPKRKSRRKSPVHKPRRRLPKKKVVKHVDMKPATDIILHYNSEKMRKQVQEEGLNPYAGGIYSRLKNSATVVANRLKRTMNLDGFSAEAMIDDIENGDIQLAYFNPIGGHIDISKIPKTIKVAGKTYTEVTSSRDIMNIDMNQLGGSEEVQPATDIMLHYYSSEMENAVRTGLINPYNRVTYSNIKRMATEEANNVKQLLNLDSFDSEADIDDIETGVVILSYFNPDGGSITVGRIPHIIQIDGKEYIEKPEFRDIMNLIN